MKLGSLKEEFLTNAKEIFLFDWTVAGLDAQALTIYRNVLESFIYFTGDILVQDLTPDHVRLYIANLSDGPNEGEEHNRIVFSHYAIIHEWVRWLCAQKFVTERGESSVLTPHLSSLFPLLSSTKRLAYCA